MKYCPILLTLSVLTSGCQQAGEAEKQAVEQPRPAPTEVHAVVETTPVKADQGDAADDPAIWYNRSDPDQSLIYGTNKKYGLEIYNLRGERLADFPVGRLNNVDIRYGIELGGKKMDIVAASNRSFNRIDIWAVDPSGETLPELSDPTQRSQLTEVYGFCLYHSSRTDNFHAFVNDKDGNVEQWELQDREGRIRLEWVRNLKLDGQVEGMVADDETGLLYVGQEDDGIYVFSAEPEASTTSSRIDLSGEENEDLEFDIEGLAVYDKGDGYLLASSQGNNRFAVFELTGKNGYLGYFSVVDGQVDGVQETDGIEVSSLNFGGDFRSGIFICQDGSNMDNDSSVPQNFKLVPWEQIAEGLRLN